MRGCEDGHRRCGSPVSNASFLIYFDIRINWMQAYQNKTASLIQTGGFIDSTSSYTDSVD